MSIFYSATERGFYDTQVHGSRTLWVSDPSWTRPRLTTTTEPGGALPDGSGINETDNAISIDIPDMEAQAPLVELPNEACLLPVDAIEISFERYAELLAGNAIGLSIVPDENRLPVLQDPPPPTADQLAARANARRTQLLQEAGQAIAPLQDAVELGDASAEEEAHLLEWKRYRIALNRLEQQAGWPSAIEWPPSPTE